MSSKAVKAKVISAEEALRKMPSGIYLPKRSTYSAYRVLFVSYGFSSEELGVLAESVGALQLNTPIFKPVFLIGTVNSAPLQMRGYIYETVMAKHLWDEHLAEDGTYSSYLSSRVGEMVSAYRPRHTVQLVPSERLPLWLVS